MTANEHQKKTALLNGQITRARNAAKAIASLSEKLTKKEKVKKLEAELHQHRLNYYELVPSTFRLNLYPHQTEIIKQLLKRYPAVAIFDVCSSR